MLQAAVLGKLKRVVRNVTEGGFTPRRVIYLTALNEPIGVIDPQLKRGGFRKVKRKHLWN